MKKWNEAEIELLTSYVNNRKTSKEIGVLMNRTNRSVERKLSSLKIIRLSEEKTVKRCLSCGEIIDGYGNVFCNRSCSAIFNNKNRKPEVYKKLSYTLKNINIKKRKHCTCKYCKVDFINMNKKSFICVDCFKWYKNIKLYKKINLFIDNMSLVEINKKAIDLLSDYYFNKKMSKNDLFIMFGLDTRTLYSFFRKNNVSLRTLSDSVSNAILNGKTMSSGSYFYKKGWHITWEGKNIFYRSSYELGYAKYLDEHKISYEVEFKRFLYFNTEEKKFKIAIPDFYLPLDNKIIEIKSDYTYKESEMNDKKNKYLSLGYKFNLLMEDDLLKLGIKIKK